MNIPEILAPAGNMDALRAAVHAGCDALYLGGEQFGARAYAGNFTQTELLEGIQLAHLYGVKVYLTVNTLFRNEEIRQLYFYLLPLYEAGLDAVIVQDIGAMEYIHLQFPDLPIHASTQMTVTTQYAYNILKDYGVTRIVPARELSIEEIKNLKSGDNSPEVEVFVQGALCVCYSGQCFMSSFMGGRSGNRGRCAGSCRLPYSIYDDKGNVIPTEGKYLLSLKDLCGLESIPELIKAGVDSFKIEGRMKKPEYVASCVRSYRKCVDYFSESYDGKRIDTVNDDSYRKLVNECREDMAGVFNRGGFTSGYYHKHNGKDMMSFKAPGNVGIVIGTITSIRKNEIIVKLKKKVHRGDIFITSNSDSDITLTCNTDSNAGEEIILNAPRTRELTSGMNLCRVFDYQQNEGLRTYIDDDRKILLNGRANFHKGQGAHLTLRTDIRGEEIAVDVEGIIVEDAKAAPVSVDILRDKLSGLGNTRYRLSELIIDADEGIFYPMKAIKDIRREGIDKLEKYIAKQCARKSYIEEINIDDMYNISTDADEHTSVNHNREDNISIDLHNHNGKAYKPIIIVSDRKQLACCRELDDRVLIYIDLQFFDKRDIMSFVSNNPQYGLALPPVLRTEVLQVLNELPLESCSSIIVRNIDELAYLKTIDFGGEVVADHTLYAMNDMAAHFLQHIYNNIRITFPVELNEEQINSLCYGKQCGVLNVYGYQPLMTMAQCFRRNICGCDHQSKMYWLRDRKNQRFAVKNVCAYCYNIIYNSVPTVIMPKGKWDKDYAISYHFTIESPDEVNDIIDIFDNNKEYSKALTAGHFKRGVE